MTQRVLGPTGSRRRRRALLAPFLLVVAVGLLLTAGAQAVHDDGLFELDKNASNNLNVTQIGDLGASVDATQTAIPVCESAPPPAGTFTILVEAERMSVTATAAGNFGGNCAGTKRSYTVTRGADSTTATAHQKGGVEGVVSLVQTASKPGVDWNLVHASVTADGNDTGDDDKCTALDLVECTYVADGIGPTTFIGGGTKDHLPVSGWQHTTGASPDKAEILNAYAGKGIAGDNHQILYFGMDRYAVDGSTDIGFWFFKNPVVANPDGTFTGNQAVGDILILGTFTQGGATSDVRVFKWVGSGGNESGTIEGPEAAFGDCAAAQSNDHGCATVNDTTIEVPWGYTFKGSAKSGWVPEGGFFEGGIDLTEIGLDGCFSSFLAETRSSPEITAVLKDFALGSFEACGATLTTTPGDGTLAGTALVDGNSNGLPDVSIGSGSVTVRDRASLNVTGISTWSGSMSFFLCGPIAAPATCESGGVPIGAAQSVTNATAQPILSDPATLTSAGRYCWRGVFTSSTPGVPNASDSSLGECFEVLPVTPGLDTQAVASPVNFGQAVQDNATLSGTATRPGTNGPNATYPTINATNGAAAGGKITFTLVKSDCSTLATGTGTNPQDVTTISGDGTYGPVSFTPDAPGTYHWKAQYFPAAGDPNNLASTHNATCDDSDETVVVSQVQTAITTRQFVFPQDKARITASGGGNLTGSVRFTLHDSLLECNSRADVKYDSGEIAISGASPQTATTNNTSHRIVDETAHYWNVSYTSTNPAQLGSSSMCVESTTVTYAGNDTANITFP